MNRIRLSLIAATLVFSGESFALTTVNQPSTDVVLLAASLGPALFPTGGEAPAVDSTLEIDPKKCLVLTGQKDETGAELMDCTDEAEHRLKAPLLGGLRVPREKDSHGNVTSFSLYGNLVRVELLLKRAALESPELAGVGLYVEVEAGHGTTDLRPLKAWAEKGFAHSKSGEDVARLVGYLPLLFRQGGSWTHFENARVRFKPVASFEHFGPMGVLQATFLNWDERSNNYEFVRSGSPIDRSLELLAP